jgi:hypothetical protein
MASFLKMMGLIEVNLKSPEKVLKKPIATWLNLEDYEKFKDLAEASGVTPAAYLRSIVIDAIADEADRKVIRLGEGWRS